MLSFVNISFRDSRHYSHKDNNTEPIKTPEKIRKNKYRANLVLNKASSINEFLKSSIGPSTIKAISDPAGKECTKVEATKASDVEQRERTKASPIMKR